MLWAWRFLWELLLLIWNVSWGFLDCRLWYVLVNFLTLILVFNFIHMFMLRCGRYDLWLRILLLHLIWILILKYFWKVYLGHEIFIDSSFFVYTLWLPIFLFIPNFDYWVGFKMLNSICRCLKLHRPMIWLSNWLLSFLLLI